MLLQVLVTFWIGKRSPAFADTPKSNPRSCAVFYSQAIEATGILSYLVGGIFSLTISLVDYVHRPVGSHGDDAMHEAISKAI